MRSRCFYSCPWPNQARSQPSTMFSGSGPSAGGCRERDSGGACEMVDPVPGEGLISPEQQGHLPSPTGDPEYHPHISRRYASSSPGHRARRVLCELSWVKMPPLPGEESAVIRAGEAYRLARPARNRHAAGHPEKCSSWLNCMQVTFSVGDRYQPLQTRRYPVPVGTPGDLFLFPAFIATMKKIPSFPG